jgi:hypothetical protein
MYQGKLLFVSQNFQNNSFSRAKNHSPPPEIKWSPWNGPPLRSKPGYKLVKNRVVRLLTTIQVTPPISGQSRPGRQYNYPQSSSREQSIYMSSTESSPNYSHNYRNHSDYQLVYKQCMLGFE